MELTPNAQTLFDLLFTKDFHADRLRAQLERRCFSAEEINAATFQYMEECNFALKHDQCDAYRFGENIPGIESSHFLEAIEILLDYGLDPNYAENNRVNSSLLSLLRFIHNGYQGADAAALFFQHGGDPNICLDGEHLFPDLDCDISWFLGGDVDSRYVADTFMHVWMVFVGYGAKWSDGSEI
ncbi:MAG: hypothetical protein IIV78_03720, partial [Oscillospiraceae bacterium]|nr:hypothetical protein [Oscillospiraceae bacterium]